MEKPKTDIGSALIFCLLLSICIVVALRIVTAVSLLPRNIDDAMDDVDAAIVARTAALEDCRAGKMPAKLAQELEAEDAALQELLGQMSGYKNNFSKIIESENRQVGVTLAPNILAMVAEMAPGAEIISREDISEKSIKDYPYIDYQFPGVLLDYFYWGNKYDVYLFVRQEDEVKLLFFKNRETSFDMQVVDSFPAREVLDDNGKYELALYLVPPPTQENLHRPYDEMATGCDMPHYEKGDCWADGPPQIKIRLKGDKTYYYYENQKPPFLRSLVPHVYEK